MYYINTDAKKSIFYTTENDIIEVVSKKSIPLIDMYGAEHLLRILCSSSFTFSPVVIIPMLYTSSELSQSETQYVHDVVLLLLDFLLRHSQYFCSFDEYVSSEQVIKSLQWLVCWRNKVVTLS